MLVLPPRSDALGAHCHGQHHTTIGAVRSGVDVERAKMLGTGQKLAAALAMYAVPRTPEHTVIPERS